MPTMSPLPQPEEQTESEDDAPLKESCHDSGIDIRDTSLPPPPVSSVPAKKVSHSTVLSV